MDPKNHYDVVSPPFWTEVHVLGGGPSVRLFNPLKHPGQVLALNDSFLLALQLPLTSQLAVFSIDNNWVRSNRAVLGGFRGEKYVALPLETWPDCGGIPGVKYLAVSYADGISEDPRVVCAGCNTGYAAVNICTLKGAKKIHLWGYDMDPHDNDQYRFWAPLFHNMVPQLKSLGVEVWNHNPTSSIDAFNFA